MASRRSLQRIESTLAPGEIIVAAAPATPDGVLPDTVGAVLARSANEVSRHLR